MWQMSKRISARVADGHQQATDMFERGIRGGITQAVKHYAKANNKYMLDYDSEQISKFLQYLHANNLYGSAMVQKLPTHGFRWINKVEELTPEKIAKLVKKDHKGYILEVDVDYPKELHKSHNELPFFCERMKIGKVEKLVPNLNDKRKYVVHIKALHQALKPGVEKGAQSNQIWAERLVEALYHEEHDS